MSEYYDTDRMINDLRWGAKKRLNITDADLARMCGVSAGLIRNRSCEGRLPELRFWTVLQIAKANGKRIVFEDERKNTK